MSGESVTAFVTKADSKTVRIKSMGGNIDSALLAQGFSFDKNLGEFSIIVADNATKAELLKRLRDLGICFSSGKEWSPAEVFEYLREIGLLEGSFKKISWNSPSVFNVSVC